MVSEFWDSRFAADHYIYGQEPNAHLVAQAGRLRPGAKVLVPGDGEGRNGVWLARQGMDVLSVDQSAVGLEKARRLAEAHGVAIATRQADLLNWAWPLARFDAVAIIFLHFAGAERRRFHAKVAETLRPGGVVILEAFRPEQLGFSSGGPRDEALLYRREDLTGDFADFHIDMLEEAETVLDEGPFHQGPAATIRLVATKPR